MPSLSLEQANLIIAAAIAKGREHGMKPLCVAVLDAGGHLIALQREDGASLLRPGIATAKAHGALGLGLSGRSIAALAATRPQFIAAVGAISPHGLVPAAGGVIVVDPVADRPPVGAVGVSGDSPDNDEVCAIAGVRAANLAVQS